MIRCLGMIVFAGCWLGLGTRSYAAPSDLDMAFTTSFGHVAPVTRTVTPGPHPSAPLPPGETYDQQPATFDIRPERLVSLGRSRYALVSSETKRQGAHGEGGEIAVSYLEKTDTGWTLERSWPELLYSGVGGEPAHDGLELHRFGGDPLLFARTAWCGMDSCSEWIGTIRLSGSGPVPYQDVLAGATWPVDPKAPPFDVDAICESPDMRAEIGPPHWRGALFSIRHVGWTARPGTLSPKTPLHLSTSYVPRGTALVMRPVVPVPTCSR